jgi:hypothetical protein
MLPGFRFLFAATLFTMSILVFGLGAAALLRAAHEQFASNPSWHAAPEATFAQQVEVPRETSREASRPPVLAMLRVEPPAAEQKASANAPAINSDTIPGPAELSVTSAPTAPGPAEPDSNAALTQDAAAPPADAKPDKPAAENPAPGQVAAVSSDAPVADATKVAASASLSDAKLASTEQAATEPVARPPTEAIPAAGETDAAASSQAGEPAAPDADIAATKVAMLDHPSATVEPNPPANTVITKPDQAKPDQSAIKKRLRARRAAQRRRMAARAARQALLLAQRQQSLNPFVQSFPQPQPAPIGAAARAR